MERKTSIELLNQRVEEQRGKPSGWSSYLYYLATEYSDMIEVKISAAKDDFWRKIDPWGFAFLAEVRKLTEKPLRLRFEITSPNTPAAGFQYESLKRRVSYLEIINKPDGMEISLIKDNTTDTLYSSGQLEHRPPNEVTYNYEDISPKGVSPVNGFLEKDFQSYLVDNHDDVDKAQTNERLALLGGDFVHIRKGQYKLLREFPTGVFQDEIKARTRILPTDFIDLVTINKYGKLALIELKFNNSTLDVISQVLNYSLFFHSYRKQLTSLRKELGYETINAKHVTYLVSNTFHPKFDDVWSYYCRGVLKLKQVIMGYMPDDK